MGNGRDPTFDVILALNGADEACRDLLKQLAIIRESAADAVTLTELQRHQLKELRARIAALIPPH